MIGYISNNLLIPILDFFYGLVPSYGLAIVALTIVIRLALFPLSAGSIRSARRMRIAQPVMQKRQADIKTRYANNPEKQQQELGKLMSEFGSPLAGCLPLLVQMPILFALFATLRGSPSGFAAAAIDSTNFLKTKTLGVAPSNTTLTIDYRVAGGGVETNVGPDTLSKWAEKRVLFKNNLRSTNAALAVTTENNITVSNPEQASGGESGESPASIRINAVNNLNSQMRAVTLQDYQARVMAMPQKFGTIFRSYVVKNNGGYGAGLYTICRDSNLNLIKT